MGCGDVYTISYIQQLVWHYLSFGVSCSVGLLAVGLNLKDRRESGLKQAH